MILNIVITTSDWIQIIIAILTFIGIITSIAISVATLIQNSKMIEEATRPNIIIYKETLNINSPTEYLVIKNIGGSLAHITSISFNKDKIKKLKWNSYIAEKSLESLSNSYIAPQQKYRIPIFTKNIDFETINFDITYSSEIKSYSEQYTISLRQDSSIALIQQHQNSNELKVISNAIQELIKRIS